MPSKFLHGCRYDEDNNNGHYESYFLRANHPEKPLAFWIRYTLFSPKGRNDQAIGEIWAVYFDGEKDNIIAAKHEFPLTECEFSSYGLHVEVGESSLFDGQLKGLAELRGNIIQWDLCYEGNDQPLLLLPRKFYSGSFPKAKSLSSKPRAVFNGKIIVNNKLINIAQWIGSENHNWGSKHTDKYAWGQVIGFDNAPNMILEVATAKLKYGPCWSPAFTPVLIRFGDEEMLCNSVCQSLLATGKYDFFHFEFETRHKNIKIKGKLSAHKKDFVGLKYYNPPGNSRTCLNSKLARCELIFEEPGKKMRRFISAHSAAFEILTDATNHNVPIVA